MLQLRSRLDPAIQSGRLPQLRISDRPDGEEGNGLLTEKDFENAAADLKNQLQRQREQKREGIHRAMIIAQHTGSFPEE